MLRHGAPGSGTPPAYAGPCDVISGGCAEAYSVTRAMTTSYGGSLFQLVRLSDSSTLNVGQTNHVVDTSGIPAFCSNTYCLYSEIYAQVNGNNLIPSMSANGAGGTRPAECTTGNSCAAPFWIDPTTGLPAIRTVYPSEYVNEPSSIGITGGTNALSVMMDTRNEGFSECCGAFGISHSSLLPNTPGTMMTIWLDYGNTVNTFMSCSTSTTFCMGIDEESANRDGADYDSTFQDIISLITFTRGATGSTVVGTVNGTQIFNNTTTNANTLGHNMAIGTAMRLGGGGDLSHVDAIFREGLIANNVISAPEATAARNNMTTFYGAHSPAACQSTADMTYFFAGGYTDNPIASTIGAWGLRQMRASQTGPIADLRDIVTNTIHTYGPAASGCGLDTAAATFCATNGCAVATLYDQSNFSTVTTSVAHDPLFDMTAASTAAQPTVSFNSLNGRPTMHITGTQMLCTGSLPNLTLPNTPIGWSVVARHTAASGTGSAASHIYAGNGDAFSLGWGSSANRANLVINSTVIAGAALDGHWHQMGWESNSRAATTAIGYLDGTSVGTATGLNAGTSFREGPICIGGWSNSGPNLSGDVAELVVSNPKAPTSEGFSSLEPTIFARDQVAWGTLPH